MAFDNKSWSKHTDGSWLCTSKKPKASETQHEAEPAAGDG